MLRFFFLVGPIIISNFWQIDLNGWISFVEQESSFVTEKHQTVNIMGAYDVWQVVIFFFSWSFFSYLQISKTFLKSLFTLQNIMSSNIDLVTYWLTNLSFTQAFMLLLCYNITAKFKKEQPQIYNVIAQLICKLHYT